MYRRRSSTRTTELFTFDRVGILAMSIVALTTLLVVRLFVLQIVGYEEFKAAADGEHRFFKKLFPARGQMYVKEHNASRETGAFLMHVGGEDVFPAVTNRDYKLVYAVPKNILDPAAAATALAPVLSLEKEVLLEKLSKKDDTYEMLKRKITDEEAAKVRQLNIMGVSFSSETFRFYPEKGLGGHLFGFMGYAGDDYRGLYGLEGYYNDILKGKEGSLRVERDAVGALIPIGEKRVQEAVDGSDLILTIDRTIQMIVCSKLQAWVLQHGADGGTVIVMNPKTGALLAMCSVPDFEPATFNKSEIKTFANPAIFTPYEPGSTFKPITMAMALDQGKVSPSTTFTDTGVIKIGPYSIRNSDNKAHGVQTMTQVLEESLNTGAIFAARKVGRKDFLSYAKAFGFGSKTGIELSGEVQGSINALSDKNEIYLATTSFGQGFTVTPLQLTAAFGAIANGGNLMQPYLVHAIVKPDGNTLVTKPKVVRRVISERSATLLSGMLVNVVRKGHGKRAGVPYYYVAGKTGTAQVPRKDGRGYEAHVSIGSFVGFAPVDNPQFVMLVKIDRPRDVQWAESSAAPLFGDIAKFLVNYLEIPPDEPVKNK